MSCCSFRVVLGESCSAYQPFLDFFLSMDTINDSAMNCAVSTDGWTFYGNNSANTISSQLCCPHASFTSFEFRKRSSAPPPSRRRPRASFENDDENENENDDDDEQGTNEVHLCFHTIRSAMHLYRAVLHRSEISEISLSYCWEDGCCTDFVTLSAKRKRDSDGTPISVDITLCDLGDKSAFVDLEKCVAMNNFAYRVTLPSAALDSCIKLVRNCFGNNVCSITIEPSDKNISFHASDKVIMRNCTIPLSMSDVQSHSFDTPNLETCRFHLHWRACSVIQQFCRITPVVTLYAHAHEYPGFLKFTTESAHADSNSDSNSGPFMYIVFAWHTDIEEEEP